MKILTLLASIWVAVSLSACSSAKVTFNSTKPSFSGNVTDESEQVIERFQKMKDENFVPQDIALFQSYSMELTNLISKAKALGDFSIRYDSFSAGTDLEEATDDVRRLTAAAGGNVVIMSLAKTYTYTEKVFVANGFIYKVAPQEIKKLQAPQK